ncbi:MAG: type II toxin-antitoxin system RelE/ParE family toxin [Alphaproteobacteria bacterium]|nr:type II toxin-antitoxin system RelE/ParE family toxin [Alphaproteobacteria bacterium]
MRVEWSRPALTDAVSIVAYVARDNPDAAAAMLDAIEAAVGRLAEHPGLGRPGRVTGTRELVVASTPYVVPYRLRCDTGEVLRVLHGGRRWPADL